MDLTKYTKGNVTRHGDTTVLVSVPGGFDPQTGKKLPPQEAGFQLPDLHAARDQAVADVEQAEAVLQRVKEVLGTLETLVADAEALKR